VCVFTNNKQEQCYFCWLVSLHAVVQPKGVFRRVCKIAKSDY